MSENLYITFETSNLEKYLVEWFFSFVLSFYITNGIRTVSSWIVNKIHIKGLILDLLIYNIYNGSELTTKTLFLNFVLHIYKFNLIEIF